MKAVVMTGHGGLEVMEIADVSAPTMGARDVLIEVHAAALNPVDYKIRNGMFKRVWKLNFPQKMGLDVAGVVVDNGMRARIIKKGTKVYARVGNDYMGTFAEYVTAEKTTVAPMPESLTFEEAAGIPLVGLTTWQCLVDTMKLETGQRILIHAGAGGVGTFAIQLAKHLGAHVATTASAANHDFLKQLGADEVIDYRKEDFAEKLSGLDAVLDTIGGDTLVKSFRVVKPGGMVVSISALPDETKAKEMGLNFIMRLGLRWMNRHVNSAARAAEATYRFVLMTPSEAQLRRIAKLIDDGVIKPVVDSEYPLEQARDAMAHLEEGHCRGKVILRIRDDAREQEEAAS